MCTLYDSFVAFDLIFYVDWDCNVETVALGW
jgi:hypothetical protein